MHFQIEAWLDPPAASFLAGIERWSVVAYDAVQIVNAYGAAIRRRDERGPIHPRATRAFAVAPVERMQRVRQRLNAAPDLEPIDAEARGAASSLSGASQAQCAGHAPH
jgi:hypothetical protein